MKRRTFLKTSAVIAAAPLATKAEIIAELSPKVKETNPVKTMFSGIEIRFLGRRKVGHPVSDKEVMEYDADVYHLSKDVRGKKREAFAFIDAAMVDLMPDKEAFSMRELMPWAEALNMGM